MSELYIGLMSGTSLDGIDAVLVDFSHQPLKLVCTHTEPLDLKLKQSLLALCQPGDNEIDRMGEVDVALGELLAQSCIHLLQKAQVPHTDIVAIGSHGQTIRHRPMVHFPFTLQIGNPHCIARRTQITTIADFRRRDMAWGGQGAPLAPAFHEFLLRNPQRDCWALNIGGMANLTFLPADDFKPVLGFDTGPGNTLLDAWCAQQTGQAFDREGLMAKQGQVHTDLLALLLADPYFKQTGPKSTGREYFNLSWLQLALEQVAVPLSPVDVQATLVEVTAQTIADAIQNKNTDIWVCGGGFHNSALMERLRKLCHPAQLLSTGQVGIDPDWIEAVAFAWLARQTVHNQPVNLTHVTGAKKADILGVIYPVLKN